MQSFLTQGRLHYGFSLSFILRIYIVDYTKNKNINKLWRVTRDQLSAPEGQVKNT